MTAYFDSKGSRFVKIQDKVNDKDWTTTGLPLLEKLDEEVVTDVTVCTGVDGFPKDLAEKVHRTVLKYSAACQPVNGSAPEYDEPWQHVQGIGNMLSDLHTIFHEVAQRSIEGFSDDPRSPLRALYAIGEEAREGLVGQPMEQIAPITKGSPLRDIANEIWAIGKELSGDHARSLKSLSSRLHEHASKEERKK